MNIFQRFSFYADELRRARGRLESSLLEIERAASDAEKVKRVAEANKALAELEVLGKKERLNGSR